VRPVKGVSQGVHLVLKTDREQISVHLGPAWYLDNQEPTSQAKDKIEIIHRFAANLIHPTDRNHATSCHCNGSAPIREPPVACPVRFSDWLEPS
jgi:hypothetical protein